MISLAIAVGRGQLVRDWHSVQTIHFELVSRYDPAKTGPLVQELEWAHAVFKMNFGSGSQLDRQAMILVPDSPFDYEKMSPSKFSGGYYLGAPWRDIIVLKELLNARQGLLHEYTHLILHHQGGRWPAWFNEGTAVFYETLRGTKEGVEGSAPEPARIAILRKGAWVPISYLTSIETASNLPSIDAVHRFYAQSWLYVHMLHLAPAYRDHFPQFRTLIADGVSTEEGLRRVYSKSLVQFDEDAREWLRQERFPTERLQAPPEPAVRIEVKIIEQLDVEIARITVAAYGPNASQARPDYARLVRIAGERCDRQPALADLAFAARLFREASTHYREALRCGISGAEIAKGLELALSYRDDVPVEEFESLVTVSGSARSHYLLRVARFFAKDYEGVLQEFKKASALPQPEEFRMTRLKAMSLVGLRRFAEAQEVAEKLNALARDGDQHQAAQLTIDDIQRDRQRAETPPEPFHKALLRKLIRVDGEVIRVDCMGERARFWVRSGSETKKLMVADPSEVINGPEPSPPLEFGCGTQRRAVIIGYQEQHDPATDTTGRIRYIEFR